VQSMFGNAKGHDWNGAYAYVASSSNVDQGGFIRDLTGRKRQPTHLLAVGFSEYTGTA